MRILGLETSCDETSAAIVVGGRDVLSNVVSSQVDIHRLYGGVVPELASRAHLENVVPVVDEALAIAGMDRGGIDGVAVTCGPGLAGPLLVGVSFAKGVAAGLQVPLIGVHHIEAHLHAPSMSDPELTWPHLALVTSGGHTNLIRVNAVGDYVVLGRTLDDAAGECFDKSAKILGLGFPGGPAIQKAAETCEAESVPLPRPMLDRPGYDFSFSGLKTALVNELHRQEAGGREPDRARLAKSVQEAIVDTLVGKALRACEETGLKALTVSGGVAANRLLRERLGHQCARRGIHLSLAPMSLCTDNAAMIAGLGYWKISSGLRSDLDLNADSRLPLPGGQRVR